MSGSREGRRGRAQLAVVVALCVVAMTLAVTAAGDPAAGVKFQQSGHFVYNSVLRRIMYVDGNGTARNPGIEFKAGGPGDQVVQTDRNGYVLSQGRVTAFDKSDLSVADPLPTPAGERPTAWEAAGIAYAVYSGSGRVLRFGERPLVTETASAVQSSIVTADGTLWIHQLDNGRLCRLGPEDSRFSCPVEVPAGHRGGMAALDDRTVFVDLTSHLLRSFDGTGASRATPLPGDRLPDDSIVITNDLDGRIVVVDQQRNQLHLIDPETLFGPGRGEHSLGLQLTPGRYTRGASTGQALALINERDNTLVTVGADGRTLRSSPIPGGQGKAGQVSLVRGDDKVYVDSPAGDQVMIVDDSGAVRTVGTSKDDPVPTPEPSRPVPSSRPTNQPDQPDPPGDGPDQPGDGPDRPTIGPDRPSGEPTERPSAEPGEGRTEEPAEPEVVRRTPKPTVAPPRQATRPGVPTGVTATAGTDAVRVDWGPANPNGASVTQYVLSWPGGQRTLPGSARTSTVTGLTSGTTYRFSVRAQNRVGQGPSATSKPAVPVNVAAAPTGLQLTAPGNGRLTANWQQPNLNGGSLVRYETSVQAVGSAVVQAETAGPWRFNGYWSVGAGDTHTREVGGTATFEFTGSRLQLFGVKDKHHGIATISVDGRSRSVDGYSPTRQEDTLLYTSTALPAGRHTVVVTMTSSANANREDDGAPAFSLDRAVVTADSSVIARTTPTQAASAYSGLIAGQRYRVSVLTVTRRADGSTLRGRSAVQEITAR
nr:fibronectin type III domain-containing protein [Kribbella italica]